MPRFYFLILNCSIINSALDKKIVNTFNMKNSKIVTIPSTSGNQVFLEFLLLSDHVKLGKKYRKNLKLPDCPLDLITLYNATLVALRTEDEPILCHIVKELQNKEETIKSK